MFFWWSLIILDHMWVVSSCFEIFQMCLRHLETWPSATKEGNGASDTKGVRATFTQGKLSNWAILALPGSASDECFEPIKAAPADQSSLKSSSWIPWGAPKWHPPSWGLLFWRLFWRIWGRGRRGTNGTWCRVFLKWMIRNHTESYGIMEVLWSTIKYSTFEEMRAWTYKWPNAGWFVVVWEFHMFKKRKCWNYMKL